MPRSEEAQIRWNRVQNTVNKIKQLPGVLNAHIDDSNMDDTGFNVDVTYSPSILDASGRYGPMHFQVKDLRSIVQKINGILRRDGLKSNSIQQPKRVYESYRYGYKSHCQGYDRSWGRFDVYCY